MMTYEDLKAFIREGGSETKAPPRRQLPLVFEHEGTEHEVVTVEEMRGKLVLKSWPIPLGRSPSAR